MGFLTIHLKELKELKADYKKDNDKFIKRMLKADSIVGPTDSMEFVEKIMKLK